MVRAPCWDSTHLVLEPNCMNHVGSPMTSRGLGVVDVNHAEVQVVGIGPLALGIRLSIKATCMHTSAYSPQHLHCVR